MVNMGKKAAFDGTDISEEFSSCKYETMKSLREVLDRIYDEMTVSRRGRGKLMDERRCLEAQYEQSRRALIEQEVQISKQEATLLCVQYLVDSHRSHRCAYMPFDAIQVVGRMLSITAAKKSQDELERRVQARASSPGFKTTTPPLR